MSNETENTTLFPPKDVQSAVSEAIHRVPQGSQFVGLYSRELLRTFRNPWVLVITIVQPFMWLAFFGSSFANVPLSAGSLREASSRACSPGSFCAPSATLGSW